MQNDSVAPIDHSTASAVTSTAAGAAGGALKTGALSALGWIGALTVGGALLGVTIATGGVGGLLSGAVLWPVSLGLVGLGVGTLTSPFAGVLGGMFGGAMGGTRAAERVRQERGAASEMQAQVSAYQAQAMAMAAAANDNKYNFPAQGTAMNPAMSTIQRETVADRGVLASQQLERA